jgi:1-aminocyclopropane-1-carboxylate deaminase/D-cysteine desulfhydrase-like pyridoxal-dependent ACC family enzyme
MQEVARSLERKGRKPYVVPLGGSTPEGALAYAQAFAEMDAQIDPPDVIIHSTSSGGTQAGLAAGAALCGSRTRILGVSADDPAPMIAGIVSGLVAAIGKIVGVSDLSYGETSVDDSFVGAGYGIATPASSEALELAARSDGLLLDPVYTAKAMAALIAGIRARAFISGQTVLFWHTGGLPALFA